MAARIRVLGREECGAVTGTLDDHSGSIAAANTSQQVAGSNPNRSYLFFQNQHASADMWLQFDGAAVKDQPSIRVGPGLAYEPGFVDTRRVNVICDTMGAKFTCKVG